MLFHGCARSPRSNPCMVGSVTRGDEQSTYFQHADTGLSRDFNAFIDALLASKDIVVATKSGTITMPRVDVKDAKKVRH